MCTVHRPDGYEVLNDNKLNTRDNKNQQKICRGQGKTFASAWVTIITEINEEEKQ